MPSTSSTSARHDGPAARERAAPPLVLPAAARFRVAAELLDSRVEYLDVSVYDLDQDEIGEFDLVVMGYVLQMLRDPLRALEAVRDVCRGHLMLLDTVSLPLSLLPSPVARLDARRDGFEWFVFNRRGLARACRLAGFAVEAVTPILARGSARRAKATVGRSPSGRSTPSACGGDRLPSAPVRSASSGA